MDFIKQISEKYSNIKFNENPSMWSRSFQADRQTDGQRDRHENANSLFFLLKFYERPRKEQSVDFVSGKLSLAVLWE